VASHIAHYGIEIPLPVAALFEKDLARGRFDAMLSTTIYSRGYSVNKTEFVEQLAKEADLTKKDARKAVEGMVDLITNSLAKNEPVVITGFGKFEARTRKASTRMNPQTGNKIKVPAKVVPAFKAGKTLKTVVGKKAKKG